MLTADRAEELVEEYLDELFWSAHQEVGTKHGDITPDQHLHLEKIKMKLKALLIIQVNQNL